MAHCLSYPYMAWFSACQPWPVLPARLQILTADSSLATDRVAEKAKKDWKGPVLLGITKNMVVELNKVGQSTDSVPDLEQKQKPEVGPKIRLRTSKFSALNKTKISEMELKWKKKILITENAWPCRQDHLRKTKPHY